MEVTGNQSPNGDGGGIWCSGNLTLTGFTDIHDNIASSTGKGGGVYMDTGSIRYWDVKIGNNQAGSGDGAYLAMNVGRGFTPNGFMFYGGDEEFIVQ